MKKLLAIAVAVVLGATIFFSNTESLEKRCERAQHQVALLRDERGGSGSGFVVIRENDEGQKRVFLWTAAHVVDSAPTQQTIRFFHFNGHKSGHATFPARVIVYSKKHDLALMLVDCPPDFFRNSVFANDDARLTDYVFVVGNPLGEPYDGSVHIGHVSQRGVTTTLWGVDLDQTTAIIVPGNSGGPVFNKAGEVVGVVVGWARLPGIGLYVPLRQIRHWAARAGIVWAMLGDNCPSDDVLEKYIARSAQELAPPAAPPTILILPLGPGNSLPIPPDPPVIPIPICP